MSFRLESARLVLRSWRGEDAGPFLEMGSDPRVMEFLGPPMDRDSIESAIDRQSVFQKRLGYCFWAVERLDNGVFLGFCGLKPGREGTPLEGRMEIGWRLAFNAWGQGFAREASEATLRWGFDQLAADAIWAITVPGNFRSWGLMERIGMLRQAELDFDHPDMTEGNPLCRHIVYAVSRPAV